jgi:hypothetical protein
MLPKRKKKESHDNQCNIHKKAGIKEDWVLFKVHADNLNGHEEGYQHFTTAAVV